MSSDIENGITPELELYRLKKESRHISIVISLICKFAVILCIFSCVVLAIALFLPDSLSTEKKVYLGTIVSVGILSVLVGLFFSRTEPAALLFLIILTVFLSGFVLGISTLSIRKAF